MATIDVKVNGTAFRFAVAGGEAILIWASNLVTSRDDQREARRRALLEAAAR